MKKMTHKKISKKNFFQQFVDIIKILPKYNRRYDFFSYEEILELVKFLKKKGVLLVDAIDWSTCNEFLVLSKRYSGQAVTQIALTFRKS